METRCGGDRERRACGNIFELSAAALGRVWSPAEAMTSSAPDAEGTVRRLTDQAGEETCALP
jgi:hypothetical protein